MPTVHQSDVGAASSPDHHTGKAKERGHGVTQPSPDTRLINDEWSQCRVMAPELVKDRPGALVVEATSTDIKEHCLGSNRHMVYLLLVTITMRIRCQKIYCHSSVPTPLVKEAWH